jgi:hypothetical protein
MSTEDREQILTELLVIRRYLGRSVAGVGAGVVALALVVVSDHYDQRDLRQHADWMRPKVEALWYRADPDVRAEMPSAALIERKPVTML